MSNADLIASSGLIINLELAKRPAVRIVIQSSWGFVVNARNDRPLSVKDERRNASASSWGLPGSFVMVDHPVL